MFNKETTMKAKAIQLRDITKGASFDSMNTYNVNIVPGIYVQIFGTYRNHVNGPQNFHKVFVTGSEVEYDSYNLKYTGKIVAIGQKTVSIKPDHHEGVRRLRYQEFCWRNWDFNSAKTAAYNADEMQYL